jgi:coatomer protein complex subunit alpha (xenin)
MREVLPAVAFELLAIKEGELAEANRYFSRGKFPESLSSFRTILQKLLVVVAKDEAEAEEVSFFVSAFLTFYPWALVLTP